MRPYVIRLLSTFFETIAATFTAYFSAPDLIPFLKAHHHRDTTFDPGLLGFLRK